jgi:hypothetical protein
MAGISMFDLNVLCIGQKQPTLEIEGNENIWIEAKNDDPTKKPKNQFYGAIAPVMNYLDGFWYNLYLNESEIAGTHLCDYIKDEGDAPFWVQPNAKISYNTLIIQKENLSSFRAIIKSLIRQSPIRTVMVFCRYQTHDREVILGTFTTELFFEYLAQGKILTNVCYVVSDKLLRWLLEDGTILPPEAWFA